MSKREGLVVTEFVTPTGSRWSFGTAIPTTGTAKKGDMVWNTAPAAAGTLAWVCTAAGTPGTWKAVSGIAA